MVLADSFPVLFQMGVLLLLEQGLRLHPGVITAPDKLLLIKLILIITQDDVITKS